MSNECPDATPRLERPQEILLISNSGIVKLYLHDNFHARIQLTELTCTEFLESESSVLRGVVETGAAGEL